MATYAELLQASDNSVLHDKMRVAVIIAAQTVWTEAGTTPNHANRLIWAKAVFASPETEARRMLWSVLAQNSTLTLAQILGASDSDVQTAVNNTIDLFAS